MVKSIVMYPESTVAGDNTTILEDTGATGTNQAIVDFQMTHDTVIKIK
jgi:hypothetical protein